MGEPASLVTSANVKSDLLGPACHRLRYFAAVDGIAYIIV